MSTKYGAHPFLEALKSKRNAMSAVVLRDMRTRFFDHGIGFLVVSLWPFAHILILLTLYKFTGRQAPYGDSVSLYSATGLIPTLLFMYVSRFMSLSVLLNKPLLSFPAVTVTDVLAARAFLEITAAALTLLFVVIFLLFMGDDPYPYNLEQAVCGYLASILLAVGVGTVAGVIVVMFNPFLTVYALFMVVVYLSSGTIFIASALPDYLSYPLSFNPVLQCVEWIRSSYYPTYDTRLLDKSYVIIFGLCSLFVGLFAERVARRKMMEG